MRWPHACLARTLALVLLIPVLAGCSLVLVRRPPGRPPDRFPIECTSVPVAPAIDVALTVGAISGAVVVVARGSSEKQSCDGTFSGGCKASHGFRSAMDVIVPLSLASFGLVTAFSAGVGFTRTAECGAMHDAERACAGGDRAGCSALGLTAMPAPATPAPAPPDAPAPEYQPYRPPGMSGM